MYQAEEQEPPDIPATILVLFAAVPGFFPSMLQGSASSSACALVLLLCTHSPTLCLRSVVWSQLASPPCSLRSQGQPVSPLCPSKCLCQHCGTTLTGRMSFSGQNILDSTWQVLNGCCQMETESFLLGDSSSIRVSSPFHDSDILKIVKA